MGIRPRAVGDAIQQPARQPSRLKPRRLTKAAAEFGCELGASRMPKDKGYQLFAVIWKLVTVTGCVALMLVLLTVMSPPPPVTDTLP